MNQFGINPYHFILCLNGEYVVWNYETHKQFAVSQDILERLRQWSMTRPPRKACEIDYQLLGEKLIINKNEDKASSWKCDILSQIFHIGTSSLDIPTNNDAREWNSKYIDCSLQNEASPLNLYIEKEGGHITLPAVIMNTDDISFADTCSYRKTSRSFINKSLSLNDLSYLLFVAFGDFHKNEVSEIESKGFKNSMLRKTSPSAGGLHCNEAYVVIQNVSGVERGVYHYSVKRHGLTFIQRWEGQISQYLCDQYFANDCAFGVFITAYLDKLWWKYPHSRGYRMALADSGHLSQMFHLSAASRRLDSWITGAFDDRMVSQLLKLEGPHQAPLLFVAAGYGLHEGIPDGITQSLPVSLS